MIKATFYKTIDDRYKGFSVSGHAGYAKAGKDIICASVSALVINTVNSIENLTSNKTEVECDEGGTIKFKFADESDEKGQLLVDALCFGLTEISNEHGHNYLKVYFKEV